MKQNGFHLKGETEMKKIFAIILTASLAFAMAACDKKDTVVQGGPSVDENGNEIAGTAVDGAGKEADIDKLDGQELKEGELKKGVESKGKIAGYNVSIDKAKIVETDDQKVLVVSMSFKNNSSKPMSFDGIISVDVMQNQKEMLPTVVTGLDGINILSGTEVIEPGKSTTIQKTFTLFDEETPVYVYAYKYGEADGDNLAKIFNLK